MKNKEESNGKNKMSRKIPEKLNVESIIILNT